MNLFHSAKCKSASYLFCPWRTVNLFWFYCGSQDLIGDFGGTHNLIMVINQINELHVWDGYPKSLISKLQGFIHA